MSGWQRQSSYTINNTTQDSIIINTRTTGPSDTENRIYSPVADQLWWNGNQILIAGAAGGETLQEIGANSTTNGESVYTIDTAVSDGVIFSEDTGGIITEQIRISKTNTAATPILSFFGDTTTGLYRPGANTIGFATAGSEALRITSTPQVVGVTGAIATPTYTFTGVENHGMFFEPSGVQSGTGPSIVANGIQRAIFGTSNTVITTGNLNVHDGNLATTSDTGNIWAQGTTTTGGQVISGNPGLRVGLGIVRASATAGADWEDGHLGNANYLYFGPLEWRAGGGLTRFESWSKSSTAPNPWVFFSTNAGVTTVFAIKTMPKGFRIKETDGPEFIIRSANGTTIPAFDVTLHEEVIDTNVVTVNSGPTAATWTANSTNNLVTIIGNVSTGNMLIILELTSIAAIIPETTGIVGARVPIERA